MLACILYTTFNVEWLCVFVFSTLWRLDAVCLLVLSVYINNYSSIFFKMFVFFITVLKIAVGWKIESVNRFGNNINWLVIALLIECYKNCRHRCVMVDFCDVLISSIFAYGRIWCGVSMCWSHLLSSHDWHNEIHTTHHIYNQRDFPGVTCIFFMPEHVMA